jgi:class 3 adenylate cyclase/tetratricopeptide (TPR) repeat protein
MTFEEIVDQALAMLQRRGRIAYRTLKRQFNLDDDALDDLKVELIEAQQVAIDEDGNILVWTGKVAAPLPPASAPAAVQARPPDGGPRAYTPPHLAEKILMARPVLEGERKQVTVLFADLKDSTELIHGLDPEAAQQLLDPALHRMMDTVHRFEGTVNQVLGDGIMALFGAPIAHEDHALRACYAALAMQAVMRSYTEDMRRTRGLELWMRVGLNSGEVVVRAIGNDLHMEYSAVGETTHLAARMEQLATPGSSRLTAATLRLVEGLVQVTALGPVPVKGLVEPVEVFELAGAGPARTRLQAFAVRGLTPFVGRQAELAALHGALEQAGAGHGQVVAVIGEPGVGKSRLFAEFLASPRTEGWRILETHTVSYGQATPYLPIRDLLKAYFQLDDRDDERAIREKVDKCLTLDVALQPTRSAVLALLDMPVNDPEWQALGPSQRRLRTIDGVKRLLLRQSQVQPLLVSVENLHWIDAGTQAVLDSLIESLPTSCLLLLVNYRPEYQHGWGSKTYYTQLRLDPLPPASAEAFLAALLGGDISLASLTPLLIARTEGNPFFLEESIRTLVETEVLVGTRGAYRLVQPIQGMQVPATVQAVLAARIDRVPPEDKRLLQTAAVVGTDVPFALLRAIADVAEEALHRGLAHLQAAEFLYETRLFPEHAYTFKHALTHEVAYRSLLQERRRMLHARIVEAIEALAPDRLAEQVERLAHHALRGEVWDKALAYFQQAGEKAMARPAYREAVEYFEQALSALSYLPETRATREQAVDLRLALRSALRPLGEFGRILVLLCEAEALAEALDDSRRLGRVSRFLINHFRLMGAYEHAIAAGKRALALAKAGGDDVPHALANQELGYVYRDQGDYRQAIDCFRQTVAALDAARHRERFGQLFLPAVVSRAYLTVCHAELGTFPVGRALGDEGLRIAEAVNHPASLMVASWGLGLLSLRQGDLLRALPRLEWAMGLCRDADIPAYFPVMAEALGAAYALAGRGADAVPLLTQALEQTMVMGTVGHQTRCRLFLGEAQILAGRLEEAHAVAERAWALAREHQERGHQAYVLCLLGKIASHRERPDSEQAETHYRQALTLAEELGMRPLMAHCHLGLGMLYHKIDRREQARDELSTAIELYQAMEMTFWLPQAEAGLAQV